MIAALFALAATMIVAGVTAVVEGFPYVRLESGMAMVYGGSVVGSSGVLLLGLAVVATFLKRVERAVRAGLAGAADKAEATPDPLADEFQLLATPPAEPVERPRIEPSMSAPPAYESTPLPAEPELPLPGLTLVQPAEEKRPEPAPTVREITLPLEPARPIRSEEAELASLRSSLDAVSEPVPEKAERTAVGRYSSGGNTYVMFDDGTIEADTPNGRFNFASLDELKAFVDGGGEKKTRGAA